MPNVFDGSIDDGSEQDLVRSVRVAIVVSRYNESITDKLLDGAMSTFTEAGVADESLDVAWVPGAWEIPVIVKRLAESNRYSAVVALGAVIRGETTHDQHINRHVSMALGEIALQTGCPIPFGILTCNSMEQAIHRSGGRVGNKGIECAATALEMIRLNKKLPS